MVPNLLRYNELKIADHLWLVPSYEDRSVLVIEWVEDDLMTDLMNQWSFTINGVVGVATVKQELRTKNELDVYLKDKKLPDNFDGQGMLSYFELDMGWIILPR